jgi:GNAT superfamily N-acetyltransferase
MSEQRFILSFEEALEPDIPELTAVMARSFDNDSQKHLGKERGGPEGYDNGDFFRKWLFGYQETDGYKVLHEGRIIGGIVVWILPEGDNILGTVFVDPLFQDQGVGVRIWQYVESRYPSTRSWRLSTPSWATKNHYFYEKKCGFQRIEKNSIQDAPDGEYLFRKVMHPEE